MPSSTCKNRRFPDFRSLIQHAKNKSDCVFHKVLQYYLTEYNKEYERAILFPRKWSYDQKKDTKTLYFANGGEYYDIKVAATNSVKKFFQANTEYYPLSKYNYSRTKTAKQQVMNIINTLFKYGFEATLMCPFSECFLKLLTKHEKHAYLPMCPCRDVKFHDIDKLILHARQMKCDNHRTLYEYLRYFEHNYNDKYAKKCSSRKQTKKKKNDTCKTAK